MFLHNLLENLRLFWDKHWRITILFSVAFILFLIPQLFWGKLYIAGGDDTRLYYIYPLDFLTHFNFNIISNNTLGLISGYAPVSFYAPMFFIIYLLKFIPYINVQFLMYGLNLSIAFIFMYLYMGLLIKEYKSEYFYIKIISSLFYVLSLYVVKTLYADQLISVYLLSVLPATLYFFVLGVAKNKIHFTLVSVLVFSIFSSTLITIPRWYPFILLSLPSVLAINNISVKTIIKHLFIAMVLFFLLNFYWLIHMIYPYLESFGKGGTIQYLSSKKFNSSNNSVIYALADLNNPLNQFYSYIRNSWSEQYVFPISYSLNVLFISIIVFAGVFKNKLSYDLNRKYVLVLLGLLLSFIMFTPNMGLLSLKLFLFLNDHFPFFSMLRNMYDKFSLILDFYYSLSLAISLTILFSVFKSKKNVYIKRLLLLCLGILILFNARNFIFPIYDDSNFSTRFSGNFNQDYIDLVNEVASLPKYSKFIWLPLNQANYVYIEDKTLENHFYFGPSPLRILADQSDVTGFSALNLPYDTEQSENLTKYLKNKQYTKIGELFKKEGISYIIINRENLPNIANNFLYPNNILRLQEGLLKSNILGKKINDFGTRYTLYKINPIYSSSKIYTSNSSIKIQFQRKDAFEYLVSLNNLNKDFRLFFVEPFDKNWTIYLLSNDGQKIKIGDSSFYNKYINSWNINIQDILRQKTSFYNHNNKSINIRLLIYFYPETLNDGSYIISVLAALLSLTYVIVKIVPIKKR